MISRIMRVDRDDAVNTEATHLSTLLQEEQKQRDAVLVSDFYYQQPNPYVQEGMNLRPAAHEFGAMLYLGHTDSDERTYGGFTPEAFAEHVDQAFEGPKPSRFRARRPYTYADKLAVRDLYLIGCTLGRSSPGKNDAYAQRLVNRLHEKGFINARVHTVAYEPQDPMDAMYVEVITRPAVWDKTTKPGYLAAYSLGAADASEIRQKRHIIDHATGPFKEQTIATAKRAIDHIYERARIERPAITAPISPVEFLRRAENTYLPHETYRQRKQRIAQDTNHNERQRRAQLIALLTPVKDRHKGEKQIPFIRLLMALEQDYEHSWQQHCAAARVEYDKTFNHVPISNKVISPDDDLRLLEKLGQGMIPSPEAIESAASQHGHPEEKTASLSHRPSARKGGFVAHPMLGFFPSAPSSPKSAGPIPEHLRNAIEKLHEALEDEIMQLRDRAEEACITLFLNFEMNTKVRKRDSLEDLLKATSLDDLQAKARAALGETRVTWRFRNSCSTEWRKSRTQELLKHIVDRPNDRLPEDRQPMLAVTFN